MTLTVDAQTLNTWVDNIVPKFDYYYLPELDELSLHQYNQYGIILSRKELLENAHYFDFNASCFLKGWTLSKDVHWMLITKEITADYFPEEIYKDLLQYQIDFKRHHIFSSEQFCHVSNDKYTLQEQVVFQKSLWDLWSVQLKKDYLTEYAEQYIEEIHMERTALEGMEKRYPHLAQYFNKFNKEHGANCFSSTAAALSENMTLIQHWMDDKNLVRLLRNFHYVEVSDDFNHLSEKDVVLWSKGDLFIHASYYLGDNIFFNKQGQECFNPWQLSYSKNLLEIWGKDNIHIFRKQ